MRFGAALLVFTIVLCSIFLFIGNATAIDAADLIEEQNTAALKLWSDLQVLGAKTGPDTPKAAGTDHVLLVEHVFQEMVEFSRRNFWILQSASRLNFWFIPTWLRLSIEPVTFIPGHRIDHIDVPPDLSDTIDIEREGMLQIEAYQRIRNYALPLSKIELLISGSIYNYVLPTIYASLEAYLYGFRLYSQLIRQNIYLYSAAYGVRYSIAMIAGLVIGLFGSFLPKTLALSPLAVAFLVGYAVEAFLSRLDDTVAKLNGAGPGLPPPAAAETGSG